MKTSQDVNVTSKNVKRAQEAIRRVGQPHSLDEWARRSLPKMIDMINEMPRTKASAYIVTTLYETISSVANFLAKLEHDELLEMPTPAYVGDRHAAFHNLWTGAAKALEGTTDYDKAAWQLVENQLVKAGMIDFKGNEHV